MTRSKRSSPGLPSCSWVCARLNFFATLASIRLLIHGVNEGHDQRDQHAERGIDRYRARRKAPSGRTHEGHRQQRGDHREGCQDGRTPTSSTAARIASSRRLAPIDR